MDPLRFDRLPLRATPARGIRSSDSTIVDLVAVDSQILVSTDALIDLLGWARDYPEEFDTFSMSTERGQLVTRLFFGGAKPARGVRRYVPCQGRLPRGILGFRYSLGQLYGAEFYDRSTQVTLADDGESLYLGKYWLLLYTPEIARPSPPPPAAIKETLTPDEAALAQHIRLLDVANVNLPPAPITQLAERYERDEALVRLIKRLRGPACQICGRTFEKRGGGFYAECHHLETLANGGLDISSNILVLCAHHHAQFHHGEVVIKLHTAEEIRLEIDGVPHTCAVGPRRVLPGVQEPTLHHGREP